MNLGEIIAICLVIFLIIIIFNYNKQEHFDIYRNHDFGAYDVYKNSNIKLDNKPIKSVDQAVILAKYNWNNRDALGNTVYDKMYDNIIQQKVWNINDDEYGYKNIDKKDLDDIYDSKFSVLDKNNEMAHYKMSDMVDKDSIEIQINGQTITLAQKQY